MRPIAAIALLLTLTSQLPAVDLKVPPKVEGATSEFIKITAETPGSTVKWKVIDPGITLFPMELLKDTKTAIVMASRPGTYRLFAVTALKEDVSDIAVVQVIIRGDTPPGPQPPPTPPPPPPPPDTPLVKELRAAFAQDGGSKDHLGLLQSLYSEASRQDFLAQVSTWKQLHEAMGKAATSMGVKGKLVATQTAIAAELKRNGIPSAGSSVQLDASRRRLASEQFRLISEALGALK